MCNVPLADEKKIVLVCDDSKCCLNAMKRALQSKYHVITASSGYEAVSFAHLYVPDIIIMDVMMYGMNGFEVVKKLQKNAVTRHIPVVFLSALTEQKYKDEGAELGAAAYMTKPFDLAKLIAAIEYHTQDAECAER